MNGRAAASGDRRAMTAAASGPCRASRARSSSRRQGDGFRQIGREVGEVDVLAAGVDHQEQAVFVQARDHQVVDDAAGLVGEQRVALAAGLQAGDVAGDQAFQRGGDVGAGRASPGPCARRRTARRGRAYADVRPARRLCSAWPGRRSGRTAPAWRSRRTAPCGRRGGGARRRAGSFEAAWGWDRLAERSEPHVSPRTGPSTGGMPAAMTPLCHGT